MRIWFFLTFVRIILTRLKLGEYSRMTQPHAWGAKWGKILQLHPHSYYINSNIYLFYTYSVCHIFIWKSECQRTDNTNEGAADPVKVRLTRSISLHLTWRAPSITFQQGVSFLHTSKIRSGVACMRHELFQVYFSGEYNCNHSSSSYLTILSCDDRVLAFTIRCRREIPTEPVSIQRVTGSHTSRVQLVMQRSLINAAVSDFWVKRQWERCWLQNLYLAMAPSWHSLEGLEVLCCQRFNLLKRFTCHVRDICFLWKDRELMRGDEWEGLQMRYFPHSRSLEESKLNFCFLKCQL